MKHKYDWSSVPDHIGVIVTCEDGTVKWFSKTPIACNGYWINTFTVTGAKPFEGDWKESLEGRPE